MTDESNGESTFEFVEKKVDDIAITGDPAKTGEHEKNLKQRTRTEFAHLRDLSSRQNIYIDIANITSDCTCQTRKQLYDI